MARILEWFAVPSSGGLCFDRTLHSDPSMWGGPRTAWLITSFEFCRPLCCDKAVIHKRDSSFEPPFKHCTTPLFLATVFFHLGLPVHLYTLSVISQSPLAILIAQNLMFLPGQWWVCQSKPSSQPLGKWRLGWVAEDRVWDHTSPSLPLIVASSSEMNSEVFGTMVLFSCCPWGAEISKSH